MTKQTIQKYDASSNTFRNMGMRFASLPLVALVISGMAGAQTAPPAGADWDISGAKDTVTALVGVGVAVTIALVVFKLGKRAANKV
jgi:uncharacterized membrane protein YgaE (UPF0421/DUF939 family)